jgi:hypothetical protein
VYGWLREVESYDFHSQEKSKPLIYSFDSELADGNTTLLFSSDHPEILKRYKLLLFNIQKRDVQNE